jgi:hypothetical protein
LRIKMGLFWNIAETALKSNPIGANVLTVENDV